MTSHKEIIIIGGGGHARVLLDVLQIRGAKILGYLDVQETEDTPVPYLGDDDKISLYKPEQVELVNGIGSVKRPERRAQVFERFKKLGYYFHSVVHPHAVLSPSVYCGEGVQIMAGVIINTGARISDDVIVNTKASIDHDCVIGAHSHIAPGVTISGGVRMGTGCHIGTGANIIQGITLGDNVLVAAGETVREDCASGKTVFGKR